MQISNKGFESILKGSKNKIDYNFHDRYSLERESLQNSIICKILKLKIIENCNDYYDIENKYDQSNPVVIMTAGPIGVGKTTVINWLVSKSYIELHSFVIIDIDEIRELLPETPNLKLNKDIFYGVKTQKESGLISELCIHFALSLGRSIIIDSAMSNIDWQLNYIKDIKDEYKASIIFLHVSASINTIKERIQRRSEVSNRFIPNNKIEETLELNSFEKFKKFKDIADKMISIDNNGPVPVLIHPWHLKWDDLIDLLGPNQDLSLSTASTVAIGVSVRRKKSSDGMFSSPLRSSFYIDESDITNDNVSSLSSNKELPPLVFVPNMTPESKTIRKREKNITRYRKSYLVKLPEIDMTQLSLSQSTHSSATTLLTTSTSSTSFNSTNNAHDSMDDVGSHDPPVMTDTIDTSILHYIKCVKKFIKTVDDDIHQLNEEIGCVYDTSLYGKGFDSRTHSMNKRGNNGSPLTIATSNTLLTESNSSLAMSTVSSPSLKFPRHSYSVRESLGRKRSNSNCSFATIDTDSDNSSDPTANSTNSNKGCESCRRDGYMKCPLQSSKCSGTVFSFPLLHSLDREQQLFISNDKKNWNNTI